MKSILIPTDLSDDLQPAVRVALSCIPDRFSELMLLIPGTNTNATSGSGVLRQMNNRLSERQFEVLDTCRDLASAEDIRLKVHIQNSLSAPIMKNLLQTFGIGLIIIPGSFSTSSKPDFRNCLKWISSSRLPILQLCDTAPVSMKNALFVENESDRIAIGELQQEINRRFPIQIVSQAKLSEEDSLLELLKAESSLKDIDLVVRTRPSGKKKAAHPEFHEELGLPVLTFSESAV